MGAINIFSEHLKYNNEHGLTMAGFLKQHGEGVKERVAEYILFESRDNPDIILSPLLEKKLHGALSRKDTKVNTYIRKILNDSKTIPQQQ